MKVYGKGDGIVLNGTTWIQGSLNKKRWEIKRNIC